MISDEALEEFSQYLALIQKQRMQEIKAAVDLALSKTPTPNILSAMRSKSRLILPDFRIKIRIPSVDFEPFRFDGSRFEKLPKRHKELAQAYRDLEIDPNGTDQFYANLSEEAFWQEVTIVRWLKKTKQQGRLQYPAETKQLNEFIKTGQISSYTLGRFIDLIIGQPYTSLLPDNYLLGASRGVEVAHYSIEPPTPDNAGWDAVFDWFYSVPRWVCAGLIDLSHMIGYTHGAVRNKHVDYKLQYGEQPMQK